MDDSNAAQLAKLARTNSPWGSRWICLDPADTMGDRPWTSQLYIFDSASRHSCLVVEARDHDKDGLHCAWVNEKTLFVRCWWSRILSTDLILDVDEGRSIYAEDANYFRLVCVSPDRSPVPPVNEAGEVVVTGAVSRPGKVPFREGLTVADILEQAGGYSAFPPRLVVLLHADGIRQKYRIKDTQLGTVLVKPGDKILFPHPEW